MRIGILTTGQIAEDARFIEAAKEQGHEAVALELMQCSIKAALSNPAVYYDGEDISQSFDIIIPRLDVSYTDYGLAILRQFQAMGVFCTDTDQAIELGRDKLRCLQMLMAHKVPFPETGLAESFDDLKVIVESFGGGPFVIKLIEGTQGTGVFLVEDFKEAENIIGTLKAFNAQIIVQKFIKESSGVDLRCVVIGDEVVASVRRESQDGDFRANIGLGGCAFKEEISDEERDVVLNATKAIGLNIAGVDLIRSDDGPLILEINVSPDFAGGRRMDVTGIDVGAAMIEYAVKQKIAQ